MHPTPRYFEGVDTKLRSMARNDHDRSDCVTESVACFKWFNCGICATCGKSRYSVVCAVLFLCCIAVLLNGNKLYTTDYPFRLIFLQTANEDDTSSPVGNTSRPI